MRALIKKSLADVTRRKGRTLLVVLGIFIGVFGLTAINVAEDTIIAAYAFSLSGAHPDITIQVDKLDNALLPALEATPNVSVVQYESILNADWEVSRAPGHVQIIIVSFPDLAHIPLTPFQLVSGRYPTGPGEVVMEYGDRGLQQVDAGDMITIDTSAGTRTLTVVGLARTAGEDPVGDEQALGYMSDAGLAQLAAGANDNPVGKQIYAHLISVKVASTAQVSATAAQLRQLLTADGVTVFNLNIPSQRAVSLDALEGVFTLLRLLAALAVVLSAILILNTITTLIAEQTAIIGTMKAIGGTRGAILRSYLTSVIIYALLGTAPGLAAGLVLGYAMGYGLAATIPLAAGPFELVPWIVAISLAVGFGVPVVAALLPLWNGTHISVREALSAYSVTRGGGRGPLAWLGERVTFVAQTTWLGLLSVFRKRGRTALTLLTLTLSGACFLVVQTTFASVNAEVGAIDAHYAADVTVRLRTPETLAQFETQLGSVGNITQVERFDEYNASTSWGTLRLIGVEPATQLYHYQLTGGRWLTPDDTNVLLLSDDALAKTGLHLGETLTLTDDRGVQTFTIIGTVREGVDVPGWIGAAVLQIGQLNQFEGQPQPDTQGSEFLIQASDHSTSSVDRLATDIDAALNGTSLSSATAGSANVETIAEYTARRQENWNILYELLYAVALAVGAVGVLGLANALTASVLERRREIGMLRAMGARGWRVARVFWVEGLALSGIAWVLGVLVGLPAAYGFMRLVSEWVVPVQVALDPSPFAVMLVAIVAIASLASIAPALRASRMRLADILRYE